MPPFYISVKSSTAGVKRDHVRGKVSNHLHLVKPICIHSNIQKPNIKRVTKATFLHKALNYPP